MTKPKPRVISKCPTSMLRDVEREMDHRLMKIAAELTDFILAAETDLEDESLKKDLFDAWQAVAFARMSLVKKRKQ